MILIITFLIERKIITRKQCRRDVAMRRIDQRQKLMEARTSDRFMFYTTIRNQREKLSMYIDHVNVDGTTYNSDRIMNGWQYHFSKLAQKSDNSDYDNEYLLKLEKEVKMIT